MQLSYSYPAIFEPVKEGGFVVTFRDVPEAITQGETMEEAKVYALDALITGADFYQEDGRPFPEPSEPQEGEVLINLPALIGVKLQLRNLMGRLGIRPSELARRMGIRPQEVSRLLNLRHSTKFDSLCKAVDCLGYEPVIGFRPKPSK